MHPKERCDCAVDPNDAAAVEAHTKRCEKRPESFDYCSCEVDQGDEEAVKAHHTSCGRKSPSASVLVRHAETAASDPDVERCHVCSISTLELETINSTGLVQVKGLYKAYTCPAHVDCPFPASNYWNEGVKEGEEHRVVTMDQATGEIIDPCSRTVVRPEYLEKADE